MASDREKNVLLPEAENVFLLKGANMARIEAVEEVKSELDVLIKKRDMVKEDIKNMQTALEQDVQKRMMDTRKASAKVYEDQEKLKADRAEFAAILASFNKEKEAFIIEKKKVMDTKEGLRAWEEKIGTFVRMVKAGAEKL